MSPRTTTKSSLKVGQAKLALFLFVVLALNLSACSAAVTPAASNPTHPATVAAQPPTETVPPTETIPPTATPLPTLTPIPSPVPDIVYVDVSQNLGAISPLVYGSNYGPWLFVTNDVKPQAIAAKLTFLRFPGGNWGDLNDIDDWQINQYMALCKELGTTPQINVRLRGGTPEKAAELVRKINIEMKLNVRYWAIGNEPNLYSDDYDTKQFNQDWRKFAEAMRAVDPSILLMGPETSQFSANPASTPKDKAGLDWVDEFLKANGDKVDIISVHRYPFPIGRAGTPPSKADLYASSAEWDQIIPALRSQIRKFAGRDLPVAVTEVNSSWATNFGGETTIESFANGLWWGDVLGRMIRQGTDIVAQFAIIGDLGLMNKYQVYPIYYVYQMYQRFGTQRVLGSSPDAEVSLFPATREDGTLTLMFVNRGSAEKKLPIKLDNFKAGSGAEKWLFDATHNAESVALDTILNDQIVTLPAESMVLYILPAEK